MKIKKVKNIYGEFYVCKFNNYEIDIFRKKDSILWEVFVMNNSVVFHKYNCYRLKHAKLWLLNFISINNKYLNKTEQQKKGYCIY